MSYPTNVRYTKSHEWVRQEGENVVVGITDFAQDSLGEVVYIEMPELGTRVSKGDGVAEIESTKAVSDIYAPLDGAVSDTNSTLEDDPETVNQSPYDKGWLFRLRPDDLDDLDDLMDAAAYAAHVAAQG